MINIEASKIDLHWTVHIFCDVDECTRNDSFTLKTEMPNTPIAYQKFEEKGWKRGYPIPSTFSFLVDEQDKTSARLGDVCPACYRKVSGIRGDVSEIL